ncbi:hypothetical protein [Paraburkholderia susongensis]
MATCAWGVARTGRGMLIATEAHNGAGALAKDLDGIEGRSNERGETELAMSTCDSDQPLAKRWNGRHTN